MKATDEFPLLLVNIGSSVLFQGRGSGASQFMVHFNIRSRYMGEITGMKAAFQGNTETLLNLLLNNLTEAESSNGW